MSLCSNPKCRHVHSEDGHCGWCSCPINTLIEELNQRGLDKYEQLVQFLTITVKHSKTTLDIGMKVKDYVKARPLLFKI